MELLIWIFLVYVAYKFFNRSKNEDQSEDYDNDDAIVAEMKEQIKEKKRNHYNRRIHR